MNQETITYDYVLKNGELIAEKSGCTFHRLNDGKVAHFFMHSPKTGNHIVTELRSRVGEAVGELIDTRPWIHWKGFLAVQ